MRCLGLTESRLFFFSDGYNDQHIRYEWEGAGTDGQRFVPSGIRLMPNYMLTNMNLSLTMSNYVVGE